MQVKRKGEAMTLHKFKPDWAVPPGQVVQERLEYRGMTAHDLAVRANVSAELVKRMLAGKTQTPEWLLIAIAPDVGMNEHVLMGIERNWRKWRKRQEGRRQ